MRRVLLKGSEHCLETEFHAQNDVPHYRINRQNFRCLIPRGGRPCDLSALVASVRQQARIACEGRPGKGNDDYEHARRNSKGDHG